MQAPKRKNPRSALPSATEGNPKYSDLNCKTIAKKYQDLGGAI